jgi:hypothetical protein
MGADHGGDDLADWAVQRGPAFFLKPDAALLSTLGKVSSWATSQSYEPAAVNTLLQVADYYLVAHSLAHGHTVVTHEVAAASTNPLRTIPAAPDSPRHHPGASNLPQGSPQVLGTNLKRSESRLLSRRERRH